MHFSRHGWHFGQTRCSHLQGTIVRTLVLIHRTTGRHTSAVTPVALKWLHMVTSRLWLVGRRKSHTIWQLYVQHCDRSNVLTTLHTALRQEQCAHYFTYSTATGAKCCCKESPAEANESRDSKKTENRRKWSKKLAWYVQITESITHLVSHNLHARNVMLIKQEGWSGDCGEHEMRTEIFVYL
jgi:hypothetical protein